MSEVTTHVFCDCPDCVMRDMVYVRLKEQIKFVKPFSTTYTDLQKILDGEK